MFHVATSLDNYIARKGGAIDWILGGRRRFFRNDGALAER